MTSRSNYKTFSSYSNTSSIKIVNGKVEKFVEESLKQDVLPDGRLRQVEVKAKKTKDGIEESKTQSIDNAYQKSEHIYPDIAEYLDAHRGIPLPVSRISSTRENSEQR